MWCVTLLWLVSGSAAWQAEAMFTIEHEFDCTVITLVDEGEIPLQDDVIVNAFSECVTVEQVDPISDRVLRVTLSHAQVRDLAAALDLPEGIYRLVNEDAEAKS